MSEIEAGTVNKIQIHYRTVLPKPLIFFKKYTFKFLETPVLRTQNHFAEVLECVEDVAA
jgi:hypothetical protein